MVWQFHLTLFYLLSLSLSLSLPFSFFSLLLALLYTLIETHRVSFSLVYLSATLSLPTLLPLPETDTSKDILSHHLVITPPCTV